MRQQQQKQCTPGACTTSSSSRGPPITGARQHDHSSSNGRENGTLMTYEPALQNEVEGEGLPVRGGQAESVLSVVALKSCKDRPSQQTVHSP